MAKQVRRVVTGHDADGKAIVISDGPAPFVHVNAVNPEWYSTDIWRTKETPARIATAAAEPTLGPRRQLPDKQLIDPLSKAPFPGNIIPASRLTSRELPE